MEMNTRPGQELTPELAWREDEGTATLRSRYSGYPLKKNEMVITVISQGSLRMGHQVIAFEWHDDGLKNSGVSYRKHKAFHLYPAKEYRGADPATLAARFVTSVPGTIERTRASTLIDGVPKSTQKHKFGSDEDAKSRLLTHNATYRSWKVDFNPGWAAFTEAKKDWKNPPTFNLANISGYNCAGWVQKILRIAGISTGTISGSLGFPVPANEVAGGQEVLDEDEMWKRRGK